MLEIEPIVTLIHWRIQLARGETINTEPAHRFGQISAVQTVVGVMTVFAATAVARGLGV